MRLYRFRALLQLDPAGDGPEAVREYPCGTHSLMVAAGRLGGAGETRYFPAAIYRMDGQPLRRGDPSAVVTIEVADNADDVAREFLDAGQHFTVWNGTDTGRGVISRRVFFTSGG